MGQAAMTPSWVGRTSREKVIIAVLKEMVPNQRTSCLRLRECRSTKLNAAIVSSPFSSSLLAFFLKVFHHDARSRFEGGEAEFCDVDGIGCCGAPTAAA